MKKYLYLFLILLICSYVSKSEILIFHPGSLKLLVDSTPANRNNIQKKLIFTSPFQGTKIFCKYGSKSKYIVSITGNNVLIVSDKAKIKGVFKRDKLFTNDPEEIEYRKIAGKYNYGKYYVIGTDYFCVLNVENGEYSYYTLCKQ